MNAAREITALLQRREQSRSVKFLIKQCVNALVFLIGVTSIYLLLVLALSY